jgi:uncharacterized protein
MSRSIIVRRSPIHGNGVFAARDIKRGASLIRYRGHLLSHDEADECYGGTVDTGHTFLFILNDHYVVDANRGGNEARWINHSCEPNCEPALVESPSGDPTRDRIVIEAMRDIRAGEELSYDYGIVLDVRHTRRMKQIWACRCGARSCTGTMLKSKPRKRRP